MSRAGIFRIQAQVLRLRLDRPRRVPSAEVMAAVVSADSSQIWANTSDTPTFGLLMDAPRTPAQAIVYFQDPDNSPKFVTPRFIVRIASKHNTERACPAQQNVRTIVKILAIVRLTHEFRRRSEYVQAIPATSPEFILIPILARA